jgi:hypothetical protein
MSTTSIDAGDLVVAGRYLAGQLSPEECAAFEEQLRQDPEALRMLEATARVKIGLAKLRELGDLDELLVPVEPWYQRSSVWATAAAVSIVAIGAVLFRLNLADTQRPVLAASIGSLVDMQGSALPVSSTLALFRKRTEADDAIIETSPTPQAVELRVLPETTVESGRYQVSFGRVADDGSLATVASVDDLQPAGDGFLTVFVDRSQLTFGRYRLDVVGKVPDGGAIAADRFLIRVIPPRAN